MRHTVLEIDLIQGTTAARSVPLPDRVAALTGTPALQPADLADPAFSCWLTLVVTHDLVHWHPVAVSDPGWHGGPAAVPAAVPPAVVWSGRAARARLVLDLSRPASAGAYLDVA